ncbi:EF-hand domain-containing protein [Oxalobacteraceae bacterium]|nr:EF-hand domain-containing protein [Oxalobacteraceae bacterium]
MAAAALAGSTAAGQSAGAGGDAAPPAPASVPVPRPEPYVPPALRKAPSAPPAAGAQLRQQAMQKLRQRFEEADLDASGSLTREEARRAGLGFVDQHFDQIDSAQRGKISFDELSAFLHQRHKEAMARQSAKQ